LHSSGGVAPAVSARAPVLRLRLRRRRPPVWPPRTRSLRPPVAPAGAKVRFGGAQPALREPLRVPELRVARIQVDENTLAEPRLERLEREMAADVDEDVGRVCDGDELVRTQTDGAILVLCNQCRRAAKPEALRGAREVRRVE